MKKAAKATKTIGGIAMVTAIIGAAIKKNGVGAVKDAAKVAVKSIFKA